MLKNNTLKNGTSRIGLYGSAPPRDLERLLSTRINDFLAVSKCSRLCVNFRVGTLRVHIRRLAKFGKNSMETVKCHRKTARLLKNSQIVQKS